MQFSIRNQTGKRIPKIRFEAIKDSVLGKKYDLSLVFCGNALSKKLNSAYRGKDKPTNVLSFPISENSGEIFINLRKLGGFSLPHLFIHGCLHLKGLDHGDIMDREENKFLKKFHLPLHGSSNHPRSRHRHLTDKSDHR